MSAMLAFLDLDLRLGGTYSWTWISAWVIKEDTFLDLDFGLDYKDKRTPLGPGFWHGETPSWTRISAWVIKGNAFLDLDFGWDIKISQGGKKIDESQNTTNDHIIDIISKQILRNNAHTTTDNKENADDNGNIKGRKCEKCKQLLYGPLDLVRLDVGFIAWA
ncbi:hypothetical protein GLOIN_2v1769695 [Rhizophagus irregularis DAOM 181602=DAOM 197198]|uniref:Uncharacterized protein n=1 Tax=Rhizophagus irregularis (strain DAOM 181602 / DAOM 197198 / MUCL 43194) TaxID=747089 RepID=A0A2P4QE30_RHIID|nr:hypothetical protein GLOIN_2v1769695 [Rhizophagus irregularis DAOM 181602=DAOM 197198]POG75884.1 hypothetical protein GLOIN_2v1769695 [Rhizophagus irregularis DAOM 181602=DAOM 197198]|eukprot:XP_025182750.1 hypothetical protein GLOIN_2v1769695 [Rhizophagus irregularis DAOM 181602=DAOM 197198]